MAQTEQIRIDRAVMPRVDSTDEGYLRGDAIVTRTGVFRYRNSDGSERLELRHPDDVLTNESLSTLSSLPITIDHPSALVNADNAAELSVGLTGDQARVDGMNVMTRITVTHKDGVSAVQNGKRELSLGYTTELVREDGTYNGQAYTHRQTNVRYNHLAIVGRARAGAQARINLDGAAVQSDETQPEGRPMSEAKLATVNLDGLEYQAAPEVAKALDKAQARIDSLETERNDAQKTYDEMKKEYDSLQGKMDELKAEMDKMKGERGDEAVKEAAKARVSLLSKAGKVIKADDHYDSSDREIMEAVITAKHDGIELESKSDDYVLARFDSVIESLPDDKAIQRQAEKVGARADSTQEVKTDHRADASNTITNMWKKEAAK